MQNVDDPKSKSSQTGDLGPWFEIPYYHDYISPKLAKHLIQESIDVPGVKGLRQVGRGGGLESSEGLDFLVNLYAGIKHHLAQVLAQRIVDRRFIDERVKACFAFNRQLGRDISSPGYMTILGLEDVTGRIVCGPLKSDFYKAHGAVVAPIPDYLQGPHVTLFGPPDSAKMAINAMNAYHRKLRNEPTVVEELLATQTATPKWGADDEDSKTPIRADLIDAAVNLTNCFDGSLTLTEGEKTYQILPNKKSNPIKRFPGLALPCTFLFYEKNPIPLHLYDFALHAFRNWNNPEALTFYVPKLENEEEARYIHNMVSVTESMLKEMHPAYRLGTIRLMVVLENPRAILRTNEIMDALYPYFVGASLGWHDYLGSTARLFKEDGNYRIPVKADPNIVIKYIKASHSLLADVVGQRGGIKVGGMYGILPQQYDIASDSFQVTLKGFFKDVITQLKRDLTGFWVAHPDFVRLGLAITEAWKLYRSGDECKLFKLTKEIFRDDYCREVDEFIRGADIQGLHETDQGYVRSLLVADIQESDFIANNHPDEIRYNVFQTLQYLTDWLTGNGCVALPTVIEGIPVRVMDDLATAERSRWEVWHEIYHGRFAVEDFLQIVFEEMRDIRKDNSTSKKIVQVKYDERTSKWYPIALKIMLKLMTDHCPAEFATELLLPFTIPAIRESSDPWKTATALNPNKYQLENYVDRWSYYFERCGSKFFCNAMAKKLFCDADAIKSAIMGFSLEEINEAASFHGDIGEPSKTLDHMAKNEQRAVSISAENSKEELRRLGGMYKDRFGFKFLIAAKGRSASEIQDALKQRLSNSIELEKNNARQALYEITMQRIESEPKDHVFARLQQVFLKHGVVGAQISTCDSKGLQNFCFGQSVQHGDSVSEKTLFELASLSKTLASAFACEFFSRMEISLDHSVNELLTKFDSPFRLQGKGPESWADAVTVSHLMSHVALNMHYVKGFPLGSEMPTSADLLVNHKNYDYEKIEVVENPGEKFQYSGGGFIVLEHLIECIAKKPIYELTEGFLRHAGLNDISFDPRPKSNEQVAHGYMDDMREVLGGRLMFPAFAAGALGTAHDVLQFLRNLSGAFSNLHGCNGISHDTAVAMLFGQDRGCRAFMGCDMGLGVFVAEMGLNRVAIHQGANEGFRAIYVYVIDGPDAGKGFVALCNADNRGVGFIAEVSQVLLSALQVSGVDFGKFGHEFDDSKIGQEQIVNLGYKKLVFDAFLPRLPEPTKRVVNQLDPFWDQNLLNSAEILACSNQRFARAENLISKFQPEFLPDRFGSQGKEMDSWESARHNRHECDVLDLRLKQPSDISFAKLSTKFHDGNQAQFIRILGKSDPLLPWQEILKKVPISGHSYMLIDLQHSCRNISDVRIEMYPDGGLTRVSLYRKVPEKWHSVEHAEAGDFVSVETAKSVRYSTGIPRTLKPLTITYEPQNNEIQSNIRSTKFPIDWACSAFGGRVTRASNEHYGPAAQVVSPFPPIHMFDGLESSRSRDVGHFEDVEITLGRKILISRIVFDFKFFVNNNPRSIEISALTADGWQTIKEQCDVKAFAGNLKEVRLRQPVLSDVIRIKTLPDGGINRIHVYEH